VPSLNKGSDEIYKVKIMGNGEFDINQYSSKLNIASTLMLV